MEYLSFTWNVVFIIIHFISCNCASHSKHISRNLDTNQPVWSFTSLCEFGGGGNIYVSNKIGKDNPQNGRSIQSPYATIQYAVDRREPCQTIYIMEGTYYNENFGKSQNNGPVVKLHNVQDLKITNYADEEVTIKFDGGGGFAGGGQYNPVVNFELSGIHIEGPNNEISFREAMSHRLLKTKRYSGRGVAIWGGNHIYIHDVVVHHCPGSGIRVNSGDYVTVSNSKVYSNTWWSSAAESAIVFAESKSIDNSNSIKMQMVENIVYDNINKIPYYNKNYNWYYTPLGAHDCPTYEACFNNLIEGCPWQCRYGKTTQDYIIDGSGIYVTRNDDTYFHGYFDLSSNISYGNGINGLVVHRTDRAIVKSNIIHDNGMVPRLDIPETAPQDWHAGCDGKSRQPYSGLVLNNAGHVSISNNKVAARYDDDFAYQQVTNGAMQEYATGSDNLVCRGKVGIANENLIAFNGDLFSCLPQPPMAPTPQPSKCPTPSYTEAECFDYCHLRHWKYLEDPLSFPAEVAKENCQEKCDDVRCEAFSLQFDYNIGNGNRLCYIYFEPIGKMCEDNPLNVPECVEGTMNGQLFFTENAFNKYGILNLET